VSTFEAREQIRRAVHLMLKDGPDAGLVKRPVIASEPDGPLTTVEPRPLPAIKALMDLRGATSGLIHEQARYARGDGESWLTIGRALYAAVGGFEPAVLQDRAFSYVASDLGDGPSFAFTCGECHGRVADRGPEAGSPHDAEQGHLPGCARFAELVRIYEQD
jgi:hypothetical protein